MPNFLSVLVPSSVHRLATKVRVKSILSKKHTERDSSQHKWKARNVAIGSNQKNVNNQTVTLVENGLVADPMTFDELRLLDAFALNMPDGSVTVADVESAYLTARLRARGPRLR